jgi:hypothetical protein
MRIALVAFAAVAVAASSTPATQDPAQVPGAPADTIAEARHRMAMQRIQQLGDRASLPSDSVFRDLKVLKGMTAEKVIRIMDEGFGAALGVGCNFCHVVPRWRSEDSTQKEVARQMWLMQLQINGELLAKIPNLRSERPIVNCTTCHRGQVKPALTLDSTSTP